MHVSTARAFLVHKNIQIKLHSR